MITRNVHVSSPPDDGEALVFAADGTFLYDDDRPARFRSNAAMELDVVTVPPVRRVESYQWALYGDSSVTRHGPWVLRLRSAQEVGANFVVPGATPSFFISDGKGTILAGVTNTHGFDIPISRIVQLANAPRPITLLTFTTTTPESVCGQCWEALLHGASQ
jgi:hypothetical protein